MYLYRCVILLMYSAWSPLYLYLIDSNACLIIYVWHLKQELYMEWVWGVRWLNVCLPMDGVLECIDD